jgi:hypothetical protein
MRRKATTVKYIERCELSPKVGDGLICQAAAVAV